MNFPCSGFLFIALTRIPPKATWEGKDLFKLSIHHQFPRQRPWRTAAHWLAPPACPACFLIPPKTTCQRTGLPTEGWAFQQPSTKKMHHRLVCKPIFSRHFLNRGSLLRDDPSLCQVDKNLTSIEALGFFFLKN